jgi:hypothetical protein
MGKKPKGKKGTFKVSLDGAAAKGGFEPIVYPENKDDIEKFVVNLWLAETRKAGGTVLNVIQNPEDDLDFTLKLPSGVIKLELVELIYSDVGGNPYEADEFWIESFELAEKIVALVDKKSEHYGGRQPTRPIHLLLYITHWQFLPSEVAIRLAQHFLHLKKPIFENIFFLSPVRASNGSVRVLYPSKEPLEGRHPTEFIDHRYLNLNPSKFEIVTSEAPRNTE